MPSEKELNDAHALLTYAAICLIAPLLAALIVLSLRS